MGMKCICGESRKGALSSLQFVFSSSSLKILSYAAFLPVCPLSGTEISVKAFLQTDEEIRVLSFSSFPFSESPEYSSF